MGSLVPTAYFSIFINGSAKGFFLNSCGLCQGDLLSLAMFIIVAEALSLLSKAVEFSFICKFRIDHSTL